MKILRKVFCEGRFEGVYLLKAEADVYTWNYVDGTAARATKHTDFDYPIMNMKRGREGPPGQDVSSYWLLKPILYFEEGDLDEHNPQSLLPTSL